MTDAKSLLEKRISSDPKLDYIRKSLIEMNKQIQKDKRKLFLQILYSLLIIVCVVILLAPVVLFWTIPYLLLIIPVFSLDFRDYFYNRLKNIYHTVALIIDVCKDEVETVRYADDYILIILKNGDKFYIEMESIWKPYRVIYVWNKIFMQDLITCEPVNDEKVVHKIFS